MLYRRFSVYDSLDVRRFDFTTLATTLTSWTLMTHEPNLFSSAGGRTWVMRCKCTLFLIHHLNAAVFIFNYFYISSGATRSSLLPIPSSLSVLYFLLPCRQEGVWVVHWLGSLRLQGLRMFFVLLISLVSLRHSLRHCICFLYFWFLIHHLNAAVFTTLATTLASWTLMTHEPNDTEWYRVARNELVFLLPLICNHKGRHSQPPLTRGGTRSLPLHFNIM